ncbi:MAG: ADP-glyceromanno-heptose 6-epimerase [Bdellovibrionales bacterium RIFOXYD1_FULL_44_7]|nr:MAG: ADP-glyceromanno-heptose 6-epimerase [Bdellovibrionales bacterium RIFOXYD1_FULL_44_7]
MEQKKSYLVTGAAGFIGARFVESCNKKNISVISVDAKSHFTERREHKSVLFERIIDRDQLLDHLKTKKPSFDCIVHIGACSNTMEFNTEYLNRMNVEYSKRLWTYATEMKIPFVYASSAATYGGGELGYSDDESLIPQLKPLNPYGESKQIFDLWALEQEKRGLTPPAWSGFKYFNVYGFGERHKGRMASVVMHAFDQINTTGKVRLFKSHRNGIDDGHQKRDFIFVQDVVDVMHYAVEKPLKRGIYNLGTGKARTFLDLARGVFSALAKAENIEFIDTPESIRERYQYFTEAKMERLRSSSYLKPFTSLEDGINKYITKLRKEA